jgi:Arc/MetJ-type ribon-helix-helix transcriptional regulator
MIQAKFTLEESHLRFVDLFREHGFKDKSSVVRAALERLEYELEQEKLRQSADLYAEIYENDTDLQELAAAALTGWPE